MHVYWHVLDAVVEMSLISIYLFVHIKALNWESLVSLFHIVLSAFILFFSPLPASEAIAVVLVSLFNFSQIYANLFFKNLKFITAAPCIL